MPPKRPNTFWRDAGTVCTRAWFRFRKHQGPAHAAALSFYALITAAPLLLVAVAVLGLVWGSLDAHEELHAVVQESFGTRSLQFVLDWLDAASAQSHIATLLSTTLFSLAAGRTFVHLEQSLCQLWDQDYFRPVPFARSVLRFVLQRLVAFLRLVALGTLFAIGLALHALLTAVGAKLHLGHIYYMLVRPLLNVGYATLLFGLLFLSVPRRPFRGAVVWYGALVSALLWVIGLLPISAYFDRSTVGQVYGAAGSVVAFLVWLYYTGQLVYLGAAITYEWSELWDDRSRTSALG